MLTSTNNPQVKEILQLQNKGRARNQAGVFVVEGLRMILEAPPQAIRKLYVTVDFWEKNKAKLEVLDKEPELVSNTVFARMSDTKNPQGVLGVTRQMHYSPEQLIKKENAHLLVLDNLQDPGNVGTIFRTAEAAGVDGIFLSEDCVDIYNPKTVRGTMGAIYRLPFVIGELEEYLPIMKAQGMHIYGTQLEKAHNYDTIDYQKSTVFLFGNEGNGLRAKIAAHAEAFVKIPMDGQGESLNVAVAAAILMYEVRRQRQ